MIALRWSDINFAKGVVTISRGIVSGADGLVEKDTKTHASRRVSLDPTTVEALRAHRGRAEDRAALCEFELSREAFVFSYEVDGSKPWFPDSVSRCFTRLCKKAGLKGVRLHDLPTRLLSAGVDVRTVAGRLGHRNATTLNVYSHFLAEADRDAANVLGRIFEDAVAAASDTEVRPGSG